MNFTSIFPASKLLSVAKLYILVTSSTPFLVPSPLFFQSTVASIVRLPGVTSTTCQICSPCTTALLGAVGKTQWRGFIQNVTLFMLLLSLKILWLIFQRKLNSLKVSFPTGITTIFIVFPVKVFQTSRSSFLPLDNKFFLGD